MPPGGQEGLGLFSSRNASDGVVELKVNKTKSNSAIPFGAGVGALSGFLPALNTPLVRVRGRLEARHSGRQLLSGPL